MTSLTFKEENNKKVQTPTSLASAFNDYTALKSIDLSGLNTSTVTNMSNMFNACGATSMIVLDLGPHFTNIPSTRTDMFKDCGISQLKIYAPEAIYESQTSFK